MTPHSTERPPKMSPLDIFGAMAHSPPPVAAPSPAFKAVLNKAPLPASVHLHRQPVPQGAAEQPPQDVRQEYAPEKVSPSAGKKPPAKACPSDPPERKEDNREPNDDPAANQTSAPPAADSNQSPPQPQDAPADQGEVHDDGTQPVDPANASVLSDNADARQPLVALAEQIPDPAPQPSASAEPSQPSGPEANAAAVPTDENSAQVSEPDLRLNEPQASGNAPQSPQDAAGVVANSSPSLGEPAQDSAQTPDPVVAIDQQTAAATVEIQPVDASGKSKDDKGDDSGTSDGPQQNGVDTPQPITPSPDALTNQQTQSAAPPPPTTDSAPSLPKDAPPPQNSNSQQTAGVQPAPSRLPQHVLTRAEGHRIHNPAPVPVDSARFLSRVAKAFLSAQQREGNEVRLRLSPPELGSLRLQVSVQNGVMVARMETETEAARSSLVNNLPDLRERLAEQGIKVERFDIDLMQRPSTGTPDRPSDPQQQNEPQPLRPMRSQQAISEGPAPTTVSNNWSGQGRLNVII